jgi:hypothetical protein
MTPLVTETRKFLIAQPHMHRLLCRLQSQPAAGSVLRRELAIAGSCSRGSAPGNGGFLAERLAVQKRWRSGGGKKHSYRKREAAATRDVLYARSPPPSHSHSHYQSKPGSRFTARDFDRNHGLRPSSRTSRSRLSSSFDGFFDFDIDGGRDLSGSKEREITYLDLGEHNPAQIVDFFERHVQKWAAKVSVKRRLQLFGVPVKEVEPILAMFSQAVREKRVIRRRTGSLTGTETFVPDDYNFYQLARFGDAEDSDTSEADFLDPLYTSILYAWMSFPSVQQQILSSSSSSPHSRSPPLSQSTLLQMSNLHHASLRLHPSDEFPLARRIRRKFIMHVGPTNSGKTYHALRALAAAPTGVYAGPLRLLANEVFDRLNGGKIAPAGWEGPPPEEGFFKRETNMITGELHKIVSPHAPYASCTVEMLSYSNPIDVAVIDEIQMISDRERGFAWTNAVLGIPAQTVYLCGEETAIPVVEKLLQDTGDELEIRRYTRLTPLAVEQEPLYGDLKKVRSGDALVVFSRADIFHYKNEIERVLNVDSHLHLTEDGEEVVRKCAVVYGGLPPEIRAEQAALFNQAVEEADEAAQVKKVARSTESRGDVGGSEVLRDKEGRRIRYDVLIGSDAIGMGLNL